MRYLSWLSIKAKLFLYDDYRRDLPLTEDRWQVNEEACGRWIDLALGSMTQWFDESEGVVGVLDGSNHVRAIRQRVVNHCKKRGIQVLFLESWFDHPDLVATNISDVTSNSPNYENGGTVAERIALYEKDYQTLDTQSDSELSFVKMVNIHQSVIVNRIELYLQSRIVYYLMNFHVKPRTIWLSRHGESMYNLEGKIGGDADLSPRGLQYARKLPEMMRKLVGDSELTVWVLTLKRTHQTAQYLPYKKLLWKALDELDAGICDGLTYEDVEREYPEDFKARDENKFGYRYRGGELYKDVVTRLEPVIMELERQENILIITHQAVLRCIYAYFMNVPQEESPWMSIPLHTVIKLEPRAYDTLVGRIKADIPAVSTYKEKGTSQLGEKAGGSKRRDVITGAAIIL